MLRPPYQHKYLNTNLPTQVRVNVPAPSAALLLTRIPTLYRTSLPRKPRKLQKRSGPLQIRNRRYAHFLTQPRHHDFASSTRHKWRGISGRGLRKHRG